MKKISLLITILIIYALNIVFAQAPGIAWQNTIGGSEGDRLYSIQQTFDGGYIFGGYSESGISGDKTEANQGESDYWVVKLDGTGQTIEWQKTIGGSDNDYLNPIQQTADGGYILGGESYSGISGDKTEASQGDDDYWVIKLDGTGNILWQNTIGGNANEAVLSIQQTTDGGYILGGSSRSGIAGDKTEANQGESDYWVVKLDGTGQTIEWQNTIGGSDDDNLNSVQQTSDGGYILGGHSHSGISGDKTEASQGGADCWVVKLDGTGQTIEWQKTIGGSDHEYLRSIQQTSDGGYVLGGSSSSEISGDKNEASQGNADYWVVKLNGAGNIYWQKTIGGSDNDELYSMQQTSDGGYILGGRSKSGISGDKTEASQGGFDYWVVKLEADNLDVVNYNGISIVEDFTVLPAYPNPFNPSTTIRYGLDKDNRVTIKIYDITGKLISSLLETYQTQGWHSVIWKGTNQHGEQIPAGLYFSRIISGNEAKTAKLMLLK